MSIVPIPEFHMSVLKQKMRSNSKKFKLERIVNLARFMREGASTCLVPTSSISTVQHQYLVKIRNFIDECKDAYSEFLRKLLLRSQLAKKKINQHAKDSD